MQDIYETCCRIEKLHYALPKYLIWRDHPVFSYSVYDIFCFFCVKIFVSMPAVSLLWLSLYRSTCYVSMLSFQCVKKTNTLFRDPVISATVIPSAIRNMTLICSYVHSFLFIRIPFFIFAFDLKLMKTGWP